jgi:hypothetical protein
MTTDDKHGPDPDPWAGLNVGGGDGDAEEMTFSFEEFAEPASEEPAALGASSDSSGGSPGEEVPAAPAIGPTDGLAEEAPLPREVPLAVFPPADAFEGDGDLDEPERGLDDGHAEPGGAHSAPDHEETSGPLSLAASGEAAADDLAAADPWDAVLAAGEEAPVQTGIDDRAGADDSFNDRLLAQELAAMDDGADAAEPSVGPDFGDPDPDSGASADDLSFDTVGDAARPFVEGSDGTPFEPPEETDHGGSVTVGQVTDGDARESIPMNADVAGAAVLMTAPTAKPKKKSSGLGTALGVVGGGLLALPVTYGILLWGFQKDPFKLGRHLPQAILPAAVRAGSQPARKPTKAPVLDAGKSLDALPVAAAEPAEPAAAETAAPAALGPATAETAGADAKPEMARAAADSAAAATDGVAASPAAESAPAESAAVAVAVPAPSIAPPPDIAPPTEVAPPPAVSLPSELAASAPPAGAIPSVSTADPAAVEVPSAPSAAATMPKEDALASLDALVAKPATAPAVEPVPPLDVTAADDATALVAESLDALEAHPDESGEGRDRLLVGWYQRLAALGEELVRLQTTAYDTGRHAEATPEAAGTLLERITASDRAIADLDALGGMWMNSVARRADGVSLVGDVATVRQVGPYWSMQLRVAGGNADGSPREVSIISRTPPPDDAGTGRVLVTGVLFDGGAVWAADIRPVVSSSPVSQDTGDTASAAAQAPSEQDVTEPEEPAAANPGTP